MRIGIFGGTFDPPHVGHLILASEALHQLKLDKILWTLTADPPHKQGHDISAVTDRIAMLAVALKENTAFEISRVEIDRPGPHYALDTVNIIQQQYPDAELIYLIGADSLRDFPDWHNPDELIARVAGLGVMHRPEALIDLPKLTARFPELAEKLAFIDAPLLEISSSQIRERAGSGQPFRYFVPHDVYELIMKMNLYQSRKSSMETAGEPS